MFLTWLAGLGQAYSLDDLLELFTNPTFVVCAAILWLAMIFPSLWVIPRHQSGLTCLRCCQCKSADGPFSAPLTQLIQNQTRC